MICKANLLPSYQANLIRAMLGIRYQEMELPPLAEDEVLIKTAFAAINPSDIAFIQGGYGITKALPVVPGFEASGTIVETGKSVPSGLLHHRVAAFVQAEHQGTWAEYFIAHKDNIVLLEPGFSLSQAAVLAINPLTAFAMLELAKQFSVHAIIQNAAGGMVGHWLQFLADKASIPVINIVRKESSKSRLEKAGKYVLNSEDEDFDDDLRKLAHDLKANVVFDAVAGDQTARLLNALPEETAARIFVYGGLSGKQIQDIDPIKIIFRQKHISGFNLPQWKNRMTQQDLQKIYRQLQKYGEEHPELLPVQEIVNGSDVKTALKKYIKNMSGGKVLLRFEE